ncbi:MAG: dienelactone hydrolase family protein [Casimicrobiaceae bacterium]
MPISRIPCVLLIMSFAMMTGVTTAALPAAEKLELPSLEVTSGGARTMVPALLFRPPNTAAGATVPLIVGLHGCGGMYSTRPGSEAALSERFAMWTQAFLDDGYAVLWPDSFNPRGHRQLCTIRAGERTINAATRRLDALGALAFASALPGVDARRIAIVGWSHGGSATLATVNAENAQVAALRTGANAPPFFRAAVAFYPGCTASLRAGPRWRPATATAIHIGAADDWTPAQPCVALGEAMRAAAMPLTVRVYADSYHAFDAPTGRVAVRHDVPNGVNPGHGVTTGPNPAARAAAMESTHTFLRAQLASPAAPNAATKVN